MKTKLLGAALALGLAVTPLASIAGGVGGGNANSNWTIYGWQNWSLEFVEADVASADLVANPDGTRTRDFSRINNNAANIGFSASIDTGVSVGGQAVKATFQCEQFTFHNRFSNFTNFCNRNSKIGLAGVWGEVMFGNWLLPYNEMVAQWVDPFYDAGATSHTSIMGSVGYGTNFYNSTFGAAGNNQQGFNRRQEEVIQWFSPNWNGLTMRIATTNAATNTPAFQGFNGGSEVETLTGAGFKDLDPRIWSAGVAYTTDLASGTNLWGAVTYQKHDEWAAVAFGCDDSDDDSWRVAGRMVHDFGGFGLTLSAMYEDLEYDHENCLTAGGPLGGNNSLERDAWMVSGKLDFAGPMDFRFSYMDADDFDCSTPGAPGMCNGVSESSTGGDAFNLGLFYTMPAGTELRLTYSEVSNDNNANYDYGIGGAGTVAGGDNEHIGLGIVQWF